MGPLVVRAVNRGAYPHFATTLQNYMALYVRIGKIDRLKALARYLTRNCPSVTVTSITGRLRKLLRFFRSISSFLL